jgi:hypothetical protein
MFRKGLVHETGGVSTTQYTLRGESRLFITMLPHETNVYEPVFTVAALSKRSKE